MIRKGLDPKLRRRIIVDTREQLPWKFDMVDTDTGEYFQYAQIRGTLAEGDYSLEGLEDLVRIERKSLQDFVQTITWGRNRWEAELARLQEKIAHPYVFIEASMREIADEAYRNNVPPQVIVASLDAFEYDFPSVHFRWCGSRLLAERQAIRKFSVIEKRVDKPKRRTA